MDINEAIARFESYVDNDVYSDAHRTACKMAIHALRAEMAAEENPPITLNELYMMKGRPVWVKFIKWDSAGCWMIVGSTDWLALDLCDLSDYGVGWIAYSRPPKGDDNETNPV